MIYHCQSVGKKEQLAKQNGEIILLVQRAYEKMDHHQTPFGEIKPAEGKARACYLFTLTERNAPLCVRFKLSHNA